MIAYRIHNNEADWHTIREEVFIKEQGFQCEFDARDNEAIHLVLYQDDVAVGCGRVYQEEENSSVWHMGRLAIRKPYRKKGYGKLLVSYLEETARAHGAQTMVLSAQIQAKPFYERLSYQAYGSIYFDEHVKHQNMKKSL